MDIKKIIGNLDLLIAAIALVVLVVVTFGGVIMRYVLSMPLAWAEEVQLWCFLWLTFLGGGAAFRYGSHVAVEMVVDRMPDKLKHAVEMFDYVLVMVVLGYLAYLGVDILGLMIKIGKHTNILAIPMWFVNSIMPVGCVVMMISATWAKFAKKPENENHTQAEGR